MKKAGNALGANKKSPPLAVVERDLFVLLKIFLLIAKMES